MRKFFPPYIDLTVDNQSSCTIVDHMGGFDPSLKCRILDTLNQNQNLTVHTEYILDECVKKQYSNLDLRFDVDVWKIGNHADSFLKYTIHPIVDLQNFVCSFNGTAHVSRKLLTSALHKFGWYDSVYCSKNFSFSLDTISGHLKDFVPSDERFYKKFLASDDDIDFFQSTNSFGHVQYNHDKNIYNLEHKLTSSFLHIVSETMATSYYPFVTEKFLYSIVTRGLFLAYAQPGWHEHLERYYGFKKYNKLFDYRFDLISNPVERLVELMTMISKFSVLSMDDWRDLYEMEIDTIEFNYDHYFSNDCFKKLEKIF